MADKPVVVSEWGVVSSSSRYPNDPQMLVGNCTPGCDCDLMEQMWSVFEERSWVERHFWWSTFMDAAAAPPGEIWDNTNIFTDMYGNALTDPSVSPIEC